MTGDADRPPEIDETVPQTARIWNYWLGGKDNFPADRAVGDEILQAMPALASMARATRAFLVRTVRYLTAEVGIRQFLDVGTGLPTADNTHEVAQRLAPETRVVYVDNDPLVLKHARDLLTSTPEGRTAFLHADLREPEAILAGAARTLDLDRPVGLMLMGILGHIGDTAEARSIVRRLLAPLPAGSHLALYDATDVIRGPEVVEAVRIWNQSARPPYRLRTPEELARFFDGLELVEPGLVSCPLWRPGPGGEEPPAAIDEFGGVGCKP